MTVTSNFGATTVRSAVAKLLATENIRVTQNNSKTAYFDVERRILTLPMWEVEQFVYDMLVGHEVGHALYTPAAGWHDSTKELNIPRAYVNIVEDARIEKLIKRKYPGLVFTFNRAYTWMAENDFFGIKNKPLKELKLIDRINLQFKLGSNIKVPFVDSELPYVKMVENCETFEEVIAACNAILAYWKENKQSVQEELDDLFDDLTLSEALNGDDDQDLDYDDDYDDEEYEGEETSTTSSSEGDLNEDEDEDEEVTYTTSRQSSQDEIDNDDDRSLTDESLRNSEPKMLSGNTGIIMKMFDEASANAAMIPYKVYYAEERDIQLHHCYHPDFTPPSRPYGHDYRPEFKAFIEEHFRKFMRETDRVVSYMAKEFEQKKAAYRYSRAKVSNAGVLNTTALHKYKFSEDVFRRITTLADAKSHGMVISIDMSGSMSDVLFDTIKQALNLAIFCRRVNIPFEMYGFTSVIHYNSAVSDARRSMYDNMPDDTIDPTTFNYIQYFSHKMKKREFDNAAKNLYMRGMRIVNDKFDSLGSTPTNEMMVALSYILKKFRKETKVQKICNIILTDGEPNRVSVKTPETRSGHNMLQVSPTKAVRVYNSGNDLSVKLLKYIKDECGVTNIGYFLGDSRSMRTMLYRVGEIAEQKKMRAQIRKERGISIDNSQGYDRYIILESNSMGIDDSEFTVAEDANKKSLAKEFAKFTKNRRTSRVLLNKFVETIA